MAPSIHIFEVVIFMHAIDWWWILPHARREDLFEELEVLHLGLFGKLDVELDVEIAEIVMS